MPSVILNIDVPEIEAGIAFYTAALGLTVGRRFDGSFVELLGAEVPIYLLCKHDATATSPDGGTLRSYDRHWTAIHPDFVVDDIDEAVAHAVKAGARLESAAAETPYGKLAMLADPFGHGFCLIEFNEQGYDALIDG